MIAMKGDACDDLPIHRALERCVDVCRRDERIHALCVHGSIATGCVDEFSDLDVGCLVDDGQIDGMLANEDIIRDIAPIVARLPQADYEGTTFIIHRVDAYLLKADYNFFSVESPPSWLNGDYEVLYDRSGGRLEACKTAAPPVPVPAGLGPDELCIKLFNMARMIGRGEIMEAWDILNTLRDPGLLGLIHAGVDGPFRNYRRAEMLYSADELDRLRRTFARADAGDIRSAMSAIARYACDLMPDGSVTSEQRATLDELLRLAGAEPLSGAK